MRDIPALARLRSAAVPIGLLCASLACLGAGGMLAGAQHGVLRALFGAGGFAGYVLLFGRALATLGFPRPASP